MSAPIGSDDEMLLAQGELYLERRQIDSAIECFRLAAETGEQADRCSSRLWMAYMLLGEFELAWQQSDMIRHRGTQDPHRFWQGEAVQGKRIILRFLHGFGDAIQFVRYAPILRSLATTLVIEVPPRLLSLARLFEGTDRVITWGEHAPAVAPEWDVQVEGNELPYLFRTQLSDLPLSVNYLQLITPDRESPYLEHGSCDAPNQKLRVGLVWTAGDWNPNRSIPFESICPILDVDGCEFWNLQQQTMAPSDSSPIGEIRQDVRSCKSIDGLAATISQLDLVITVDTLAAHLAGALGTPAWVLLQHAADWRWLHARGDSPWYPSLRLFRQPEQGDWNSVIQAVRLELNQKVKITNASLTLARR